MQCPHRSRWAKCTGNAHAAFYARLFGVNYSSTKRPPPQWHALAAWHPHVWDSAESYARFVSKVAPLVEATYACGCGILPNARLSRSVAIHVRCSDVPWVRNKDYHLPDPAYWPFVERWMRRSNAPRHVLILNETSHRTGGRLSFPNADERRACVDLAAAIGDFFASHGFSVSYFRQRGEAAALSALLGAHTLVMGVASSFSFFAGLSKRPLHERFITPLLYREEESSKRFDEELGALAARQGHGQGACGVRTKLDSLFVGKVDARGAPCPGREPTVPRYATGLTDQVPFTMFEEHAPLLHGQVERRDAYVAKINSYAAYLRSFRSVPGSSLPSM